MCHFAFPSEKFLNEKNKSGLETPFHFGDFAIPTLLGLFKKKGSDRNDLEISILGSSVVSSADLSNKIATQNILCAEQWIEKFGLKLKQKKTGLPEGMQVRVNSTTGGVYLKHLSSEQAASSSASTNSTSNTPSSNSTHSMNSSSSSHSLTTSSNSSGSTAFTRPTSSSPTSSSPTSIRPKTASTFTSPRSTSDTSSPSTGSSAGSGLFQSKSAANTTTSTNHQDFRHKISDTSSTSSSSSSLRSSSKVEITSSLKSSEQIRVLIVDDSKTIRNLLSSIIESAPNMQVVGQAADAFEAENLRIKLRPDVMTLDIHMPEKDGVTYLEEVINKDPLPIVMVSDLSLKEASPVMKALEIGAFDYFQKPAASELAVLAPELINIIKAAYESRDKIKKRLSDKKQKNPLQNKKSLPPSAIKADPSLRLIAIGASTGGPDAIRKLLTDFPEKCPPIVIVQHMPAKFTKTFADSLNQSCRIKVKEAEHGDVLEDSTAYIAPGGFQMAILEKNNRYLVSINDDPPVNRFKPSVDYTFATLEKIDFRGNLNAVILTGMGSDGAYGLLGLKRKGCFTIAQDEATCVVYGMPRAAVEYHAVDISLPLEQIAEPLIGAKRKAS